MDAARKAVRKAIESTYEGILLVTEYQKKTDQESKLTGYKDVVVLENQPCKLSFEKLTSAVQSNSAVNVTQVVKLFVSPEVKIKAGSKITVTQDAVTTDYELSGIPAMYSSHQEIILELFQGWT